MFRSQEGYDNLIRVMAVKDDGREELRILRFLATAPQVLLSENHTIPLLREIDIEDLTLGVFPRVSQPLDDVYTNWSKNSVGDVLDMILQALEGLALIHKNRIAHRDAFKENFVVEYFPESLRTGVVPVHKPRVYLIDFETAVQFPEDCPPAERVCTGIPFPEYVVDPKRYKRPTIPEMRNGEPYDPFKLDVWQLGNSLVDFNSTLPPVEAVIDSMAHMDPSERLTADEALSRIRAYVESVPPRSLLIPPKVEEMP
ncbi:kinase-like domain-containing protein [Schizophyllum fasciatum]